jgi:tRNA A-37 threonylcarbamoyl transferase component Bud32
MTKRTDPRQQSTVARPSLFDDDSLSHDQRIELLVKAAISEPAYRLRFEEELARGGMGAVRQAFDMSLQRRMAVKTMHEETYDHVLLVHGFLREAQVTGQLDHPNIVPIHELGRNAHGELFFTMKLVDGESLRARIGRAPPPSYEHLKALLEIFLKICDALAFAHDRGVIHCDIKAANVMVGRFGQVYLMDWGGAQLRTPPDGVDTSQWVRDSLPTPKMAKGIVFGTPAYMSPEQASAGRLPVDERSDVFSMGALLYEIMTGKPPYTGGTAREGIARAANWELVPPEDRPHLYPRELVRIAMTAMARDPNDRYQSVEALRSAIAGLLSGGGNFPTMRVTAGTYVIREGDIGDAAYWIESGTFEVYQTRDGVRTPLRVLTRNVFFGETAIFARTTRTASVVALTDGVLKVFTAAALEGQLDTMTPWMRSLIQTMAKWFAGPEEVRRTSHHAPTTATRPPQPAPAPPDDPSVTEVFMPHGASPTQEVPAVSERGWTGLVSPEESVVIDIVDTEVDTLEPEDLADGTTTPQQGAQRQVGPWMRRSPAKPR